MAYKYRQSMESLTMTIWFGLKSVSLTTELDYK